MPWLYILMRGSMVSKLNIIAETIKDTPAENKVRAIINDCARDTALAADVLSQYMYLLDDIMRLSTIKWPPVCVVTEK